MILEDPRSDSTCLDDEILGSIVPSGKPRSSFLSVFLLNNPESLISCTEPDCHRTRAGNETGLSGNGKGKHYRIRSQELGYTVRISIGAITLLLIAACID